MRNEYKEGDIGWFFDENNRITYGVIESNDHLGAIPIVMIGGYVRKLFDVYPSLESMKEHIFSGVSGTVPQWVSVRVCYEIECDNKSLSIVNHPRFYEQFILDDVQLCEVSAQVNGLMIVLETELELTHDLSFRIVQRLQEIGLRVIS